MEIVFFSVFNGKVKLNEISSDDDTGLMCKNDFLRKFVKKLSQVWTHVHSKTINMNILK